MKKNNRQAYLLSRPWEEGWQLWEKPIEAGAVWHKTGEAATLSELERPALYVLLPARQVCAISLWISSTDATLVKESAMLQLEVAGLVSQGQAANVEITILQSKGENTLVRACAFPADYPVTPRADYAGFCPSPLALAIPEDTIMLWREGDSLVVALAANGGIPVWETCSLPIETIVFRGWLEAFLLEMHAGACLGSPRRIIDYSGILGRGSFLDIPVEMGLEDHGPEPRLPEKMPSWTPPGVRNAKETKRRRKVMVRGLLFASITLFVLALFLSGYLLNRHFQIKGLRQQVQEMDILITPSMQVARQWELLAPSIDTSRFALEKLLLAVQSLPAEGVRLSVFEMVPEGIRIEGDARIVGLATLYFNTLQTAKGGEGYEWSMPSPALQPDNSARFAIDGKHKP